MLIMLQTRGSWHQTGPKQQEPAWKQRSGFQADAYPGWKGAARVAMERDMVPWKGLAIICGRGIGKVVIFSRTNRLHFSVCECFLSHGYFWCCLCLMSVWTCADQPWALCGMVSLAWFLDLYFLQYGLCFVVIMKPLIIKPINILFFLKTVRYKHTGVLDSLPHTNMTLCLRILWCSKWQHGVINDHCPDSCQWCFQC